MAADRRGERGSAVPVIGAPTEPPEDRPRFRGIVLLAGVALSAALVVGVLAQGAERRAESIPPAIPPGRLVQDLALSWAAVGEPLNVGGPVSVVEFYDSYFLFGPSGQAGVRGYRSEDGLQWNDLGVVLPQADVSTVIRAGDRLMAAGAWYAEPTRPGHSIPAVWVSDDGTSWERSDLPFPTEPGFEYRASVEAAAVGEDQFVVFGRVVADVDARIRSALPTDLVGMVDEFGLSWDSTFVALEGPFGLPVLVATYEQLGLTPGLVPEMIGLGPPNLWTSSDLESWVLEDEAPGPWLSAEQALLGPAGQFILRGCCGSSVWTSEDGLEWEQVSVPGPFHEMAVFGDLLIAARDNGFGTGRLHARYRHPVLMASLDPETWEFITPDDLLPDFGDWSLDALSAGRFGIAALAVGGVSQQEPENLTGIPDPVVVISKDDVTVSHYLHRGTVSVTRGDDPLLQLNVWPRLWPGQLQEHVRFDVAARTISFLDPESGKVLVRLTFDEIGAARRAVEESLEYQTSPVVAESSIIYSPDAENWSIQTAAQAIGPGIEFGQVFAFDDFVLALTESKASAFADSFAWRRPGQLWLGTLP